MTICKFERSKLFQTMEPCRTDIFPDIFIYLCFTYSGLIVKYRVSCLTERGCGHVVIYTPRCHNDPHPFQSTFLVWQASLQSGLINTTHPTPPPRTPTPVSMVSCHSLTGLSLISDIPGIFLPQIPSSKLGVPDLSRCRLPPVINHSTLAYVCHYPGSIYPV